MVPAIAFAHLFPEWATNVGLGALRQPFVAHAWVSLKSAIVCSSWLLSYWALKHLPVTVASPLRASGPLFTVLGAVLVFGERPSLLQSLGIACILAAYGLYSWNLRKNGGAKGQWQWMALMLGGTILGAVSGMFDKYLLQNQGLPPVFVLTHFLPYLAIELALLLEIMQRFGRREALRKSFQWRMSLFWVALTLVLADATYFTALSDSRAQLSVLSPIRRSSVLVAFAGGVLLFREGDWKRRLGPFAIILLGIALLLKG
jgi:drug/metabolite transporter (DMT)-like permease